MHAMSNLKTSLLVLALAFALPAAAEQSASQEPEVQAPAGDLYEALASADSALEARAIEMRIYAQWAHTKSPSEALILEQATALLAQGDPEGAKAKLDPLTEIAPNYVEGWSFRALVHRELGNIPESVTDLKRALELEPKHFRALSLLGSIFEELKDYKSALKAWKAALEINPHLEGGAETVRRLTDKVKGRGI